MEDANGVAALSWDPLIKHSLRLVNETKLKIDYPESNGIYEKKRKESFPPKKNPIMFSFATFIHSQKTNMPLGLIYYLIQQEKRHCLVPQKDKGLKLQEKSILSKT